LPAFTVCFVAVALLEVLLHSKRLLLRCACRAAVAAAATAAAAICLLPAQQRLAGCIWFRNSPLMVCDTSEVRNLPVLWFQVQQQQSSEQQPTWRQRWQQTDDLNKGDRRQTSETN
jgi:hypothetical protein